MKIVSAKGTGGYFIFVQVRLNGKDLTALVDTGATSILIDEKHTHKLKTNSINNVAGLGGEFKSKVVSLNLSCNGIKKKLYANSFNFDGIHQMCDSVKVKRYDMIIGTKQILQFKLTNELWKVLSEKASGKKIEFKAEFK